MREHEDRHMVHRVQAPPAFPVLVGPGAAHGAEHVAAHDPGADALHALGGHVVVRAELALVLAEVRSLEVARAEHLGVQVLRSLAERGFQ